MVVIKAVVVIKAARITEEVITEEVITEEVITEEAGVVLSGLGLYGVDGDTRGYPATASDVCPAGGTVLLVFLPKSRGILSIHKTMS